MSAEALELAVQKKVMIDKLKRAAWNFWHFKVSPGVAGVLMAVWQVGVLLQIVFGPWSGVLPQILWWVFVAGWCYGIQVVYNSLSFADSLKGRVRALERENEMLDKLNKAGVYRLPYNPNGPAQELVDIAEDLRAAHTIWNPANTEGLAGELWRLGYRKQTATVRRMNV